MSPSPSHSSPAESSPCASSASQPTQVVATRTVRPSRVRQVGLGPSSRHAWLQRLLVIGVTASMATLITACGRPGENATVGQRVDQPVERTREAAREVGEDGREAARDARSTVMGAASDPRGAASQTGSKVDDAQITTRVNAALAADKELQGMRIDVDTQDGVVTLKGQAPTMTAKARAGDLARNVKEVKSVRNELTVPAR